MIEIDLKAGDIFTWQNYPLFTDKSKLTLPPLLSN
jgi:hypothetical protein